MDLQLTENFDVLLDDRNDLAMVSGRRELEQSIAVTVTDYFHSEIGSVSAVNAATNIEVFTRNVLDEHDELASVRDLTVRDGGDHLAVEIEYETGEDVFFPISE